MQQSPAPPRAPRRNSRASATTASLQFEATALPANREVTGSNLDAVSDHEGSRDAESSSSGLGKSILAYAGSKCSVACIA